MRKILARLTMATLLLFFPLSVKAQRAENATPVDTKVASTNLATTAQITVWMRTTAKTTIEHRDFCDPDKVVTSKYIFFTAGRWRYYVAAVVEPSDSPCVRIARYGKLDQNDLVILVDSDGDNSVDMRFGGQATTITNIEQLWQEYLTAVTARMPAKFKTAPP